MAARELQMATPESSTPATGEIEREQRAIDELEREQRAVEGGRDGAPRPGPGS